MDIVNGRFNVIEITAGRKVGKIVVIPCRKPGGKLQLRQARYRWCNTHFDFAYGYALGLTAGHRDVANLSEVQRASLMR